VWDGGSNHNHKFYVATEEEAKRWMEKNKYDYIRPFNFTVFDTIEEAADNDIAKVKERALAKLSTMERKALGF
jgi:hypothetical protein